MRKIPKIEFAKKEDSNVEFEIVEVQQLLGKVVHDEKTNRPHRVNFNIMVFVTDGEGAHSIDFKEYRYQSGSVVFIAKGQVHSFDFNPHLRGYFMFFTEKFLGKNLIRSNIMSYFSLYNYHMQNPVIHLEETEALEFLRNLQDLYVEFHQDKDFAKEDILRSMLKITLLKAERALQQLPKSSKSLGYYDEFLVFLELLKENYVESRSVSFYARKLGCSTKKLNAIVQSVVELPAKQFINEHVVLEIKRLLSDTNLHIKEITFQTGFDEPTNLVKFFKRYVGKTPSEFRKCVSQIAQFSLRGGNFLKQAHRLTVCWPRARASHPLS